MVKRIVLSLHSITGKASNASKDKEAIGLRKSQELICCEFLLSLLSASISLVICLYIFGQHAMLESVNFWVI